MYGLLKRKRLLSDQQEALLTEIRSALSRLEQVLERLGSDVVPGDMQVLADTLVHLDELFLLVIVGEFNSGKSSFINALLGASILPQGVTPTTDQITLLRYGDEPTEEQLEAFVQERRYPADVLRQIIIVDTPGTNAVIRRHEELTQNFVPRADMVLFTTSAERPFTESERAFLEVIKSWGKKVVLIINKADILEDEAEVDEVVAYVRDNTRQLLGTTPEVFPVSARLAGKARTSDDSTAGSELWQQSRFAAVENYVLHTLDQETRIQLKLLSPLGIAERLTRTYLHAVEERLGVLRDDFSTLDHIDEQLRLFKEDLIHDVAYHIRDVDLILRDMDERGQQFFDDTLRLSRAPDLIRSERMRAAFEQEVVGDVAQQVEQRVQSLIDWTIEKNLRLWQHITDYISRRRMPQHRENIIGEVGGAFDYNRNALLESIGQTANHVVQSYDRNHEAQMLTADIQAGLASSALTGAVGVGLGTALIAATQIVWLDVTGVLLATLAVTGGLFILPAKRRQAKQTFHERITVMREQISESMMRQFEREADQALDRIREAISPYTRFVRAKRDQLTDLQRDLSDIDVELERLRATIEG